MMNLYGLREGTLQRLQSEGTAQGSAQAVWIDLCNPSVEEEKNVERMLGVDIPTREEMAEIEESSRLYRDESALVTTAVVVGGVTEGKPCRTQVTFVLTASHLVTVRYSDPLPFRSFEAKYRRQLDTHRKGDQILASLLDSVVERAADILEMATAELNDVSTRLFFEPGPRKPKENETDLRDVLKLLGRKNMLVAFLRESLLSLTRLLPYIRQSGFDWLSQETNARLKQLERDVRSLNDYERQVSAEIVYLQEATLGLINLEQNRVIKVFSIAAVLFLPPTLVGTVYGMNFENMPELDWGLGYPVALGMMVISALIPYYWFRRKGWL